MMPDVIEIVKSWLRGHGYDGLYNEGECACVVADLAPCGEIGHDCKAGYKTDGCTEDCGLGCNFHVGTEQ